MSFISLTLIIKKTYCRKMDRWKAAGRMNAKRVQHVAPMRLIKMPKLGTALTTKPVKPTSTIRNMFCWETQSYNMSSNVEIGQ